MKPENVAVYRLLETSNLSLMQEGSEFEKFHWNFNIKAKEL